MSNYIFYPGCSMEGSAKAYYDSLNAIKGSLGMNLQEIDDWNCCGATEYVGMNLVPAYSLIARNLALAANQAKARGGHIARGGRRAQRDVVTLNLKAHRCAGMQAKVAAQVARNGDLAFAGHRGLHKE